MVGWKIRRERNQSDVRNQIEYDSKSNAPRIRKLMIEELARMRERYYSIKQ